MTAISILGIKFKVQGELAFLPVFPSTYLKGNRKKNHFPQVYHRILWSHSCILLTKVNVNSGSYFMSKISISLLLDAWIFLNTPNIIKFYMKLKTSFTLIMKPNIIIKIIKQGRLANNGACILHASAYAHVHVCVSV